MITLIGTGHVFNLSEALLNIFDEKQPEVICIELDKQRYNAMMLKQSDPEKYEESSRDQPVIYRLLARFQDGMADEYGVQAGEEMLTAINYAKSHQLPLAFIDMNAQALFTRMLREMSFREKLRLMFSGFGGLFVSKKRVEAELKNIEKNFDVYVEQIGKKFPTVKRVLIDERNAFMVQQLAIAGEKYEKIIAVIGDGHIPGLSTLLEKKEIDFETIRLSELRKTDQNKYSDPSIASFSVSNKNFYS
jgi:pheromone shutdown protein TraB